jgi:hypothetical protein
LGSAFDASGPGFFFRSASHHEVAGRDVNHFQGDLATEVCLPGCSLLGRFGSGKWRPARDDAADREDTAGRDPSSQPIVSLHEQLPF